ncbi:MAG: NAD(P)H-hydrate dehydratase [Sneathiella sp.]
MKSGFEILTVEQMYQVDEYAISKGVSGLDLMEAAGQGVAAHIEQGWDVCPVTVLCGPGNNGGDGYVVARALKEAGWPVRVFAYGDPEKLTGDAREMLALYTGDVLNFKDFSLSEDGLIIDALFGAGFKGALPQDIQSAFHGCEQLSVPVVSIDMPSGTNGNTGEVSPGTPIAVLTVSFFRPKIGHFFHPGRAHTGILEIIDIGIPGEALMEISPTLGENDTGLWESDLPGFSLTGHKYDRGHAAVQGGGVSSTGAARIAARCALRAGAGAVTILTRPSALMIYSTAMEAVMVRSVADKSQLSDWLGEKRIGSVLVGPGNGVTEETRDFVDATISSQATVVLDADALTVYQEDPEQLFSKIAEKKEGAVILTPHEAEFARLFNCKGSNLERCRSAARQSGAIVLLKGATTVIAEPNGKAVISCHAPPWLATAGSGDALAGLITGLIAGSRVSPFFMTAAAVWMHGEAAWQFGPGLIAEDIERQIPAVLQAFYV